MDSNRRKLNILWTSDNKTTALNLLSTYTINSKTQGWWDDVNIIIWGASTKLVSDDTQIQTEILEMINMGVLIEACRDCSDSVGSTDVLEKLGIDVKYMGEILTNYIKNGEAIITI